MTVKEYLTQQGINIPEHVSRKHGKDWLNIESTSAVGGEVCILWMTSKTALELCADVRHELELALGHQCSIWYYG